jgi:hypothetical protein
VVNLIDLVLPGHRSIVQPCYSAVGDVGPGCRYPRCGWPAIC